jgi:Ni/Co efflux regulator RcnB
VMFNKDTAKAFALANEGYSAEDIKRQMTRADRDYDDDDRPRRARDDDDDRPPPKGQGGGEGIREL